MTPGLMAPEGGAERSERIAAWTSLVIAHDALMKQFQVELRDGFDLTIPQYDALLRLAAARGSLRMGELADSLLFSSGTATKVLDRLVERGLVERTADPNDRRTVLVGLTGDGRSLLTRAQRAHGDSVSEKVGAFASAEERKHVEEFLTRLAAQSKTQ